MGAWGFFLRFATIPKTGLAFAGHQCHLRAQGWLAEQTGIAEKMVGRESRIGRQGGCGGIATYDTCSDSSLSLRQYQLLHSLPA